jgi:hypothetical protein
MDPRKAKTLAGVLAVSIAALLFAGCGGGSSATPDATTTVASDLSSKCKEDFTAAADQVSQAVLDMRAARNGTDSNSPEGQKRIYEQMASGHRTFAESLLRIDCPESLQDDLTSLVKATWEVVAIDQVVASGGSISTSDATKAASAFNSSFAILRSKLGLPPASS